jgi:hypothetical protein
MITHVVLHPADHITHPLSPWQVSTAGSSSGGSSDGSSSSSGGGGIGIGKRKRAAATQDGPSVNFNVQLLLNQLGAYQQLQINTKKTNQPGNLQLELTELHQQQPQQQIQLVSAAWLEAVLSSGRHAPEGPYSLDHLLQRQQQQQQQRNGRLATAAAAPAGPLDEDRAAAAAAADGVGSAVLLSRLPDLSNLPDAPLGRWGMHSALQDSTVQYCCARFCLQGLWTPCSTVQAFHAGLLTPCSAVQ